MISCYIKQLVMAQESNQALHFRVALLGACWGLVPSSDSGWVPVVFVSLVSDCIMWRLGNMYVCLF